MDNKSRNMVTEKNKNIILKVKIDTAGVGLFYKHNSYTKINNKNLNRNLANKSEQKIESKYKAKTWSLNTKKVEEKEVSEEIMWRKFSKWMKALNLSHKEISELDTK